MMAGGALLAMAAITAVLLSANAPDDAPRPVSAPEAQRMALTRFRTYQASPSAVTVRAETPWRGRPWCARWWTTGGTGRWGSTAVRAGDRAGCWRGTCRGWRWHGVEGCGRRGGRGYGGSSPRSRWTSGCGWCCPWPRTGRTTPNCSPSPARCGCGTSGSAAGPTASSAARAPAPGHGPPERRAHRPLPPRVLDRHRRQPPPRHRDLGQGRTVRVDVTRGRVKGGVPQGPWKEPSASS